MKSRPTVLMIALGTIGVVIAVIARQPLLEFFRGSTKPTTPPQLKRLPAPEAKVKPHLNWAQEQSERVIEEHVRDIDTFFCRLQEEYPRVR